LSTPPLGIVGIQRRFFFIICGCGVYALGGEKALSMGQ
jgi:hypothetical protein